MQRRDLFLGLAGVLAVPAIVHAGSLMRVSTAQGVVRDPYGVPILSPTIRVLRDGGGYIVYFPDGRRIRLAEAVAMADRNTFRLTPIPEV